MRPLRYLNGRTLSPVPAEARQRARVLRLKTGRATQQENEEPKATDLQGMPPQAGGAHGCSHVALLARRIHRDWPSLDYTSEIRARGHSFLRDIDPCGCPILAL